MRFIALAAALLAAVSSSAPTRTPATVATYLACQPLTEAPATLTLADAEAAQAEVVRSLEPHRGPTVGYKAALTHPMAQRRFGIDHPLLGRLLRDMLLTNGAAIHHPFAARPMMEGDLLVRVGSVAINDATTPSEALAALDQVIPFIELPDLVYATNVAVNAAMLVAANCGARYGVLGPRIPLSPSDAWTTRLGSITVAMEDENGVTLATGSSDAILGHPLHAVLWIKDALKAQGMALAEGDLLSLGTLTPMLEAPDAGTVTARYSGLPGGPHDVRVTFKRADAQ
jgi:2-keto-4-pentenoate hydratase